MMRMVAPLGVLALTLLAACSEGTTNRETDPPAAASTSENGTAVTADLLEQGREAWMLWCANCHGTDGRGNGPDATLLDPKPRDQTVREAMDALTDRDIAETIVYGGAPRGYPSMPALPQVWGEELVALVAYVRSLSHPEVTHIALTADDPL